ncbi:MAG: hypothetical protein ACO34E_16015 [Limisphaerales bacterium]|jgi:hypothetical protein
MNYPTHTFSWNQTDLFTSPAASGETTLGGVHSIRPLSAGHTLKHASLPITNEPLWKTVCGTASFILLWIAALCLA